MCLHTYLCMLLFLTNKLGFTLFSLEICFSVTQCKIEKYAQERSHKWKQPTLFHILIYLYLYIYTLLEINYVRFAENVTRIIYDDHGCEKKAPDIVNAWPGEQPSLSLEISVCKT